MPFLKLIGKFKGNRSIYPSTRLASQAWMPGMVCRRKLSLGYLLKQLGPSNGWRWNTIKGIAKRIIIKKNKKTTGTANTSIWGKIFCSSTAAVSRFKMKMSPFQPLMSLFSLFCLPHASSSWSRWNLLKGPVRCAVNKIGSFHLCKCKRAFTLKQSCSFIHKLWSNSLGAHLTEFFNSRIYVLADEMITL